MSLHATSSLEVGIDCYATFSQIRAYIPHLSFNSDDVPTKAQAFTVVRGVFQEINSLLSVVGYACPVASSNATSISILARFHSLGAASQLDLVASSRGGGSVESANAFDRQYRAMWKLIEQGQIKLPGAAQADDYQHRRDQREISYQFNPQDGVEQAPTFTRNQVW